MSDYPCSCGWHGTASELRKQSFVNGEWVNGDVSETWRLCCPGCGTIILENHEPLASNVASVINEGFKPLVEFVEKYGWKS